MDLLNKSAKHCSLADCNDLDILPFQCDKCKKIFCKLHQPYDKHSCWFQLSAQNVIPTCPICNEKISVGVNENANDKVDLHIRSGCKVGKLKDVKKAPRCCVAKCKKPQFVECKKCHKKFCPEHRFEDQHDCNGHPLSSGFGSLFGRKKNKKKTNTAPKKRARKLDPKANAIKMRMTAKGDKKIAASNRFYAEIVFSEALKKKKPQSRFFDVNAVGGRIMDQIIEANHIQYNPHKRAMQLVCVRTGGLLPMNIPLKLLNPEVCSGDTLRLEYKDEAKKAEEKTDLKIDQ